MAENNDLPINGVNNGDNTPEFFDDTSFPPLKTPPTPSAVDVDLINGRIAELEKDNSVSESRIGDLKSELEKLTAEKDAELEKIRSEKEAEAERAESSRKAAEMIAKRADQLEGEVARLQHDLITAMNDSSESTREIQKLTTEMTELKREKAEVEEKVKEMEVKMDELIKKSVDADKLISGYMQKIEDREIESSEAAEATAAQDECCSGKKLLKDKLPIIGAFSGGVILGGAIMCYVQHCRN